MVDWTPEQCRDAFERKGAFRTSPISQADLALIDRRVCGLVDDLLTQAGPDGCLADIFIDQAAGKRCVGRINQMSRLDLPLALFYLGLPETQRLADDLFGESAIPIYESVQIRNPQETQTVIWHQDMVHDRRGRVATVGLYLDPAERNNGAVQIIPDTQSQRQNIKAATADPDAVISMDMMEGQIMAHDVMLVHCSDPVSKGRWRRTVYVELRDETAAAANSSFTADWRAMRRELFQATPAYYDQVRAAGKFVDVPLEVQALAERINSIQVWNDPPVYEINFDDNIPA